MAPKALKTTPAPKRAMKATPAPKRAMKTGVKAPGAKKTGRPTLAQKRGDGDPSAAPSETSLTCAVPKGIKA